MCSVGRWQRAAPSHTGRGESASRAAGAAQDGPRRCMCDETDVDEAWGRASGPHGATCALRGVVRGFCPGVAWGDEPDVRASVRLQALDGMHSRCGLCVLRLARSRARPRLARCVTTTTRRALSPRRSTHQRAQYTTRCLRLAATASTYLRTFWTAVERRATGGRATRVERGAKAKGGHKSQRVTLTRDARRRGDAMARDERHAKSAARRFQAGSAAVGCDSAALGMRTSVEV